MCTDLECEYPHTLPGLCACACFCECVCTSARARVNVCTLVCVHVYVCVSMSVYMCREGRQGAGLGGTVRTIIVLCHPQAIFIDYQ